MSSKIKVDTIENVAGSGNVSLGSGHNLVVPGNITGSGTATITGDLAVDTNVLKVDTSNNRVGINTTSPSNDLHISSTNPVIRLQDTSTDAYAQIFTNDAGSMRLRADAGNSQGSSDFILEIDGTQQLSVDASGRVSMPNVPRFLARKNASSWTLSANSIMVWDSTSISYGYNVGSHYNTSNGKFTCPVAGTYYFEATSIVNESVSNGYWAIRKNGGTIMEQHISQTNTSWWAHSISITNEFAANDTVEVYLGGSPTGFYGQQWSYFHGRMIG